MTSTRSSRSTRIAHLAHQVVDLVARRADVDLRVDDPGRAHDLLDDAPERVRSNSPGVAETSTICGVTVQELLEGLRAVVERARQAEAVFDERLLARAVALVHAADLRDRLVGLVDEADEVLREVVDQAVRALAGLAAIEDPRVVLDPRAEADLAQHLHVVLGALAQAVGLEQLALDSSSAQRSSSSAPISAAARSFWPSGDVVVGRGPDRDVFEVGRDQLAGERIELGQRLDLVAEQTAR